MDMPEALAGAIRESELNAAALLDSALLIRDLRCAMRDAIDAIERRSYARACLHLKQALDEMAFPQRRKERE